MQRKDESNSNVVASKERVVVCSMFKCNWWNRAMNNLAEAEDWRTLPRQLLVTLSMASPNPPLLRLPTETPSITTKHHALFPDLTRDTILPDNHLMPAQEVGKYFIKIFIYWKYFPRSGHGSLSSLLSLGHYSSASFISEEKANLEIQKLRKELREEHDKVSRLQCQLSTNVSVGRDSSSCLSGSFLFVGSRSIGIWTIIGKHDFQTFPTHPHCRAKGSWIFSSAYRTNLIV